MHQHCLLALGSPSQWGILRMLGFWTRKLSSSVQQRRELAVPVLSQALRIDRGLGEVVRGRGRPHWREGEGRHWREGSELRDRQREAHWMKAFLIPLCSFCSNINYYCSLILCVCVNICAHIVTCMYVWQWLWKPKDNLSAIPQIPSTLL